MKRVCAGAMVAFLMAACTGSNGADEPDETSVGEPPTEETPVDEAEPQADDDPAAAEEQEDPAAPSGQRYVVEEVVRDGEVLPDDETVHVWLRGDNLGPNIVIGIQACAGGTASFEVAESTIEMLPDERGLANNPLPCDSTDVGTAVAQMFYDEIAWELDGEQLTLTQGDVTAELVETDPLRRPGAAVDS